MYLRITRGEGRRTYLICRSIFIIPLVPLYVFAFVFEAKTGKEDKICTIPMWVY